MSFIGDSALTTFRGGRSGFIGQLGTGGGNGNIPENGFLYPSLDAEQVIPEATMYIAGYNAVNIETFRIKSGNAGKNILFIPGAFHTAAMFKQQFTNSLLLSNHNMYAINWRGQGFSDKPAAGVPPDMVYSPGENYADDLNAVITALALPNLVIVAHSFGTVILAEYLRNYTDAAITGIVMIGAEVGPGLTGITAAAGGILTNLATGGWFGWGDGWSEWVDLATATVSYPRTRDELVAQNAYTIQGMIASALAFYAGPRGGPPPANNDALWASVTKPVRLMHGIADSVVLLSQSQTLLAKLTGVVNKQLITYQTGHMVPLEDPLTFNSDLDTFCNSI